MKLRLLYVSLAILVILVLIFSNLEPKNTVYHQSQWNDFTPEIEKSISSSESAASTIKLAHVYGGMVSHHIPTTIPKLVEFYLRLKKTQAVKNFIIIGPDHNDAGKTPISMSAASFFTAYGQLEPLGDLASKLQEDKVAVVDEGPFELEHSIGSQVLVISRIFPDAKILPIIIRSDTTSAQARELGKRLGQLIDEQTILIASIDFSHYLSTAQALPLDQVSGEVVRRLDVDSFSLIKADSGKAVEAFIWAMREKAASSTDAFEVLNTNDLMQNSDYTTGYVFGYWGRGL